VNDSAVRTRTDPRISRRRRAVARTKKRQSIVRALVAGGIVLAVWIAFFSPLLVIREVTLSGATRTTPDEVARVVGLDSSDNLLLMRTDEVAAAVKKLPWIKSVSVDRKLPGTVKVTVTERAPAMVVALGEQSYLVDRRGRVLSPTESTEGLPVLAGLQESLPDPGERLRSAELKGALQAFSAFPRRLQRDVKAVFAPTVERITFQLSDGIQVRYGAAEDTRSKIEVLEVLLARLRREGRGPLYVDIRVPEAPAVSPLRATN
jgi:cell division protein FtsQ